MGLFSLLKTNSNSNTQSANNQQDIQLCLNEESLTISAAQASGLTIAQLFERFAGGLGDTSRIIRYCAAGTIVDGDSTPVPGTIYRGAVNSESKG